MASEVGELRETNKNTSRVESRYVLLPQIMAFIRDGGRQVGKRFADVLKLFWEGLLFEYLRSEGCPLRDGERDPRHFIMQYWRRSLLDPSVSPGFVPFYLKREVTPTMHRLPLLTSRATVVVAS